MDFKESSYKGNHSSEQPVERYAVVTGGRNVCALWDGNIQIVLQTLSGTIIVFREVVGEKTGKASQSHILEGLEKHLDELLLISVSTG